MFPISFTLQFGYKSFGENSLMFFSLFDDFSYPNRVFHPFHGNREAKDPKKAISKL